MDVRQLKIIWASLLVGSLIISLVSWLVFVPRFKPVVLYFPAADSLALSSEIHYIPWAQSLPDQIRHVAQALSTGPLSMKFRRIMPSGSAVRAVYLKEKQVWIDFDDSIQAPDLECPLTPKARIATIVKAIEFNYPALQSIKILIEGQELGVNPLPVERKS